MSQTQRTFITLDGLRGIAALAVITHHASAYFETVSIHVPFADGSLPPNSLGPFFESFLAVDFFFVLSGFVLAHAYGQRLRESLSITQFMTIRLIRFYPLYLLALAIGFSVILMHLADADISNFALIKPLFFGLVFLPLLSGSPQGPLFPLNGPSWSLFFELMANLCFGLSGRWLGGFKLSLIVVMAGAALLAAVVRGQFGFGLVGPAMDGGFSWQSFGAGLLRVTYSFFAGVLVYRVWSVRPAPNVPYLVVTLLLIAILVAHPSERYQTAFDLAATLLGFPILVWLGASSIATGVVARICLWLGAASYAVYVLQMPLYNLTLGIIEKLSSEGATSFDVSWGIMFIAFVFAVAVVADRYFDRPLRGLLMKRFYADTTRQLPYPATAEPGMLARPSSRRFS